MKTDTSQVPEIWYKGQRVLRSIAGALVVLVPTLNAAAAALSAYLSQQTHVHLPGYVFLWLNGVIAVTALLAGAVSALMAVPGVNAWLTKWLNLGSVPRHAVETATSPVTGETLVAVRRDPKL